ncbi:dynamin family protein [Kineosporia corallincola]|nr:dynamin family protein [Kineosporia corallincola]
MRLAVAGQVKRGKSTLLNALLGRRVTAVGQLETTYSVTEIYHSDRPVIRVRYRDGRAPVEYDGADLARFTVRPEEGDDRLAGVRAVEYGCPAELLRSFRLVDTPGLASPFGTDSANTAQYLGISPDDPAVAVLAGELAATGTDGARMHEESVAELERADAVLYLFSRALHERDQAAVSDFLGPGRAGGAVMTPLRAFGVLSRCDQYWPPARDLPGRPDPLTYDPMEVGRRIATRYLERPEVASAFYTVVPVAGLLGLGACLMDDEHLTWLRDLAALTPTVLTRRLRDAALFGTEPQLPGVTLPPGHRRELADLLGVWGIHLACGYLREGLDPEQVRRNLLHDSGIGPLRTLVTRHFGNRAGVIKRDHALRDLEAEVARVRLRSQRAHEPPPAPVAGIADLLDRFRHDDHELQELAVLAAHYRGELHLSASETTEILRLTGEFGTSAFARLGLPEPGDVGALAGAARARVPHWARRELDPMLGPADEFATRVVRHGYERLERRSALAADLLGLAPTTHRPEDDR